MNLLVTGFGPFGSIEENPSSLLASSCGLPYQILEVSFQAVDAFIASDLSAYDALLHIGVNGSATRFNCETVARNVIGATPDVLGDIQGPGPNDPRLPNHLAGTLWPSELLMETETGQASVDAGGYLCNYIFFRSVQAFPEKQVGFLHVPPLNAVPIETQRVWLRDLLARLNAPSI